MPKNVDSIYVYNENDSLIYMQEWFYEGSNVTNEVQYTWDKEGVKHGDFNTFKAFDAKGNNVLYVTLDWDDVKQDWKGRGRFENVYNEDGKFSYHALWKEDQWKKDSIWLCQYNAQKQPILTLHQLFRNGEWQDQYKLTQGYDGSREIYHEEYSGRDANGLIGIEKWSQLYNGSTKISDRQYSWSGTEFVPKSWDTVGIVGGKTTLKESYVWTNGVQTGKSKEEWEFDGDHQTLHITYSGWENGDFVPDTKQEDEWNGSTNTISAKYNWDKTNKKWIGTTKKTENLTSDGYTRKETYNGWANNDFVPETIDSTKNENGKQVYHAKWTYSDGVWKGSSKEVYAFDGSNQLLQEKYSSWSDGLWIGTSGQKWEQIWKNNKVWSKVTYNWSSGWVPSIKDSTEYNKDNDITFSVHYKWTGSAWEGDNSKSNYSQTYISAGQKEWTTILKWENNQWNNYIQTRSIYEDGNLKEERSQQWSGTAWVDVKVVYHTWENGVETFTRTEEWNDTTQALKMKSEYKYVLTKDGQNRNIEEYKMKCGADSVWVGTGYTRNLWYYETRGDSAITSSTTYDWKNNDWSRKDSAATWKGIAVPTQTFITAKFSWTGTKWEYTALATNVYDEKGRVTSQDSKTYKNGKWVGVYWYVKEYDEWGNVISDIKYGAGSGGNVWKGNSRYDYGYDANGNQTKKVYFRWNTTKNDWEVTKQDEFTFDDKNRQTMARHSYLSAITGEFVYDSYEKYAYLGNDEDPSSTLQYEYIVPDGQETGEWILKQEDTFKYDNNDSSDKLREEIHGTWSKGVVIKYERTVYFYHDDQK